jgi:hypothetical protein
MDEEINVAVAWWVSQLRVTHSFAGDKKMAQMVQNVNLKDVSPEQILAFKEALRIQLWNRYKDTPWRYDNPSKGALCRMIVSNPIPDSVLSLSAYKSRIARLDLRLPKAMMRVDPASVSVTVNRRKVCLM